MAELSPQPLSDLLRRMAEEWRTERRLFDLPVRSFWTGSARDLSVSFLGRRASTPAGPAAGPHTQLAQNVALGWLAGARIFELKTVQVEDRLRIPRPCIDARTVCQNVEWSQELRLEESQIEYAKAWFLVHVLRRLDPGGVGPARMDTVLDASVGYSLAGIRSDPVARWLDGLRDAGPLLTRLRDGLAPDVRALADVPVPPQVYGSVTLSTFHGCPAGEIEAIALHLFERHGVDVVVKLNPTLLGREAVEGILHDRLGYRDIRLHRPAFDAEQSLEDASAMVRRLEVAAARAGRGLGVKLSNTLVVHNDGGFLPSSEEMAYLSGAPLHPLAVELARRMDEATEGRVPLSFAGGVDRGNFAALVGCGLVPVTACTDLLRPPGYARLKGYLAALEAEMEAAGAASVAELVASRGGRSAALARYSALALEDPRYAAARNRTPPRRTDGALSLLDCLACDKCLAACPNDALFAFATPRGSFETLDLVVSLDGSVRSEPGPPFVIQQMHQVASFEGACNACGNCDAFCPETGGPYRTKPRFFPSLDAWRAAGPGPGAFYAEPLELWARLDGVELHLRLQGQAALLDDGVVTARLDAATGALRDASARPGAPAGHRLPLAMGHLLRALHRGVLAGANPVSARWPRA